MKRVIGIVLLLAVLLFSRGLHAQSTNVDLFKTNQVVTLTNLQGKVFKDIKLVNIKANAAVYVFAFGAGGGLLAFTNLSDVDKARFGFDPAKADEQEKRESARRAIESRNQQIAATSANRQAKENLIRERLANSPPVRIQVFQKISDGLLIHYSPIEGARTGISLLVDCINQNATVDGDYVECCTYMIGTYEYQTVNGSKKTVLKYTASLEKAIAYEMQRE